MEVKLTAHCKHGTELEEHGPGSGDYFHKSKCVDGCLPIKSYTKMFKQASHIEVIEEGVYLEHFECGHGSCTKFCGLPGWEVYQRWVFVPYTCVKCGHGFEDSSDVLMTQSPSGIPIDPSLWCHLKCPGGGGI